MIIVAIQIEEDGAGGVSFLYYAGQNDTIATEKETHAERLIYGFYDAMQNELQSDLVYMDVNDERYGKTDSTN